MLFLWFTFPEVSLIPQRRTLVASRLLQDLYASQSLLLEAAVVFAFPGFIFILPDALLRFGWFVHWIAGQQCKSIKGRVPPSLLIVVDVCCCPVVVVVFFSIILPFFFLLIIIIFY